VPPSAPRPEAAGSDAPAEADVSAVVQIQQDTVNRVTTPITLGLVKSRIVSLTDGATKALDRNAKALGGSGTEPGREVGPERHPYRRAVKFAHEWRNETSAIRSR